MTSSPPVSNSVADTVERSAAGGQQPRSGINSSRPNMKKLIKDVTNFYYMVNENSQSDATYLSRRSALKIASVGVGTLAVPGAGVASASTSDARWWAALSFPTLAQKGGGGRLYDVDDAWGTVEGRPGGYNGMFVLPSDTKNTHCSWWSGCDYYRAKLPYVLQWSCEDYYYGDVEIRIYTNPASGIGYSWPHVFRTGNESVEVDSGGPGSALLQPQFTKENVPASNYFRPLDVRLEVDFGDSTLRGGVEQTTVQAAIPSEDILDDLSNLVNDTDEIYDEGVELADKTTPIDLGRLRKLARYYGYASSVTAGIDDDLPRAAARDGIGAFTDPIEDYQERTLWREDAVSTMGGPTIMNTE